MFSKNLARVKKMTNIRYAFYPILLLRWMGGVQTFEKLSFADPGEGFAGWGKPGGNSLHCKQIQVFVEFSALKILVYFW